MKKISRKLRGKTGESIGETLIALLISSLALMMLAGAVSSAGRIVQQSKAAFEDYCTRNNALANQSASPAGTLTVSFSDKLNPVESFTFTDTEEPLSVNYYINDKYSRHQIVSYTLASETVPSFSDGGDLP